MPVRARRTTTSTRESGHRPHDRTSRKAPVTGMRRPAPLHEPGDTAAMSTWAGLPVGGTGCRATTAVGEAVGGRPDYSTDLLRKHDDDPLWAADVEHGLDLSQNPSEPRSQITR